jgi:RimJ/RimL family protein N-acetyltransferase
VADASTVWLRRVRRSDMATHFEHQRDPAANRMAGMPPRDRRAFNAAWARLLGDPGVIVRTIVAGDEVVGSALSFVRDGEREVGYWIGREHWGQGIATAALGHLLGQVPDRPLFARVAGDNHASRRVLEKHGFTAVGEVHDGVADIQLVVMRLD